MIEERYSLKDERDKTMVVFSKLGKYYGHVLKNKTEKAPAKFVFETMKYESIEALKADYPPIVESPTP